MSQTLALQAAAVLLLLATILVACQQLGLPSLVAYLAAGLAFGPSGAGWFGGETVHRAVESTGVVSLLFLLGLDFFHPGFAPVAKRALAGAGLQVGVTAAVVALVAWGMGAEAALVGGMAVALSSAHMISGQWPESAERPGGQAPLMAAVIRVQTLAALLVVVFLRWQEAGGLAPEGQGPMPVLKGALPFAWLALMGVWPLATKWERLVRAASSELVAVTVLAVAVTGFSLCLQAGLGPEVGAFISGLTVAISPLRRRIQRSLRPFRGLLSGIFFLALGLQLDPLVVAEVPGWVGMTLFVAIVFKGALALATFTAVGYPVALAWRSAGQLSHGGELGLLLVLGAMAAGVLERPLGQALLLGLTLSLVVAPTVREFYGRLASWRSGPSPSLRVDTEGRIAAASESLRGHVIVCGCGRVGRCLAVLLERAGISLLILERDAERVRSALDMGIPVLQGDVSRPGILRAAGVDRARALAITLNDHVVVRRIVGQLRATGVDLPILVRTRQDRDSTALTSVDAEVFPERQETGLAFGGYLLGLLGIAPARIAALSAAVRAEGYEVLRGCFGRTKSPSDMSVSSG